MCLDLAWVPMTVSGQTLCLKEGALPETFPLKPKETFPMLETECPISHPANSLSVMLEIFPLTQAESHRMAPPIAGMCHKGSACRQKTAKKPIDYWVLCPCVFGWFPLLYG